MKLYSMTKFIYKLIKHNTVRFIDCKNHFDIPVIKMGRQRGHSTAATTYIKNNPDLIFAIYNLNHTAFMHQYRNFKNVKLITDGNNNSLRGIKIDYIIIENVNYFDIESFNKYITDNLSMLAHHNPRIIGIGS